MTIFIWKKSWRDGDGEQGSLSGPKSIHFERVGLCLAAEGYSMKTAISAWLAILAFGAPVPALGQTDMLPAPGFHHLHLNSVDPDAAIDFYTRQFPSTSRTSFAGLPALTSPNNVLVLFSKVATLPPTAPQTAIWHFGWHVTDVRKNRDAYKARSDVSLLPLYTGDAGGSVLISTDTWPGRDGVLGLTRAQITEAKQTGVAPTRKGGFAYMGGPDKALVEYMGDFPAERMNHVHFFHDQPFCAQLWYQKHLNAAVPPARTGAPSRSETDCRVERSPDPTWPALETEGLIRVPSAAVTFGDVAATRAHARPALRSRRAQRRRSRRLGRQAAPRGHHLPGAALPAGRHPRRHDRGPEPRGDRAG
jgi:catechol 2,3-dioxygenase-like lactoylglutathione lyase family enzyme